MLKALSPLKTKSIFLLTTLFVFSSFVSQAQLQKIIKLPLEKAAQAVQPYFQNNMKDVVRLVGLGDHTPMLKESTFLNTAIAVYLIKERQFNTVVINSFDATLRPLNSFLKEAGKETDKKKLDTLFDSAFRNSTNFTKEFKNFIEWIYNYNIQLPVDNKVQLIGSVLMFPTAEKLPELNKYFIDTYIKPYNTLIAKSFTNDWGKYTDSLVLKDMERWSTAANLSKTLPPELESQMNLDLEIRIKNHTLNSKTNYGPLDIIENSSLFKFIELGRTNAKIRDKKSVANKFSLN